MLHDHIHNRTPIWFSELEKKLLSNSNQSRRLPDQYRITSPSIPPVNPETLFNNNVFYCNSWIYSWLTSFNCLVIGKIIKSLNTEVIVEHWVQNSNTTTVSPSAASLNIVRCPGCPMNNTSMVEQKWLPKNYTSRCLIFLEKRPIRKLPSTRANKDKTEAVVGISKFMLEQTAKNTFLTTFQSQEISNPIIFHKPLNRILIEKFVLTKSYQTELLQHLWRLATNNTPTFYTDGSVQSTHTKAGLAWIEISRSISITFQAKIPFIWMTLMKAELIAIIMAFFVCKEESHVTIYTNSKSFLKKYNSLTKDNNRFRYPRANLKDTYTKYWQLLFHLIDSLQLKVTFKKVKAHNNNKHNNDADYLAKEATDLEEELNIDTCVFSQININYKHQEIERDLRSEERRVGKE